MGDSNCEEVCVCAWCVCAIQGLDLGVVGTMRERARASVRACRRPRVLGNLKHPNGGVVTFATLQRLENAHTCCSLNARVCVGEREKRKALLGAFARVTLGRIMRALRGFGDNCTKSNSKSDTQRPHGPIFLMRQTKLIYAKTHDCSPRKGTHTTSD
jgi:hypothetical protein